MGSFSEFDHLHDHLERMWDRLMGGPPGQPRFRPPMIEPQTDVYQTGDAVVVIMEITGMRGQDVELSINDGLLTVRGDKQEPHHHGDRVYTQVEIGRGPFERTVALPALVDGDAVSLRYEDGLLEITLPKRQLTTGHHIKVTVKES